MSFETQESKQDAMRRFHVDKGCWSWIVRCCGYKALQQSELLILTVKGERKDLTVRNPPCPSDIFFQNQKYSGFNKACRFSISYLVLIATFGLCFMGVFMVYMLGQNIKNHEMEYRLKYDFLSLDWMVSKGSTISVSIGIVVFNLILDYVVNMMYNFRKYRNNTDMQVGIASTSFKMQ